MGVSDCPWQASSRIDGTLPPSDDTLARAALTFTVDSADALMFATLKGAPDAWSVLSALYCSAPWSPHAHDGLHSLAVRQLESWFAAGTARWGCRVDGRAMGAFRKSLSGWHGRLYRLFEQLGATTLGVDHVPWRLDDHTGGVPMPPAFAQPLLEAATGHGRFWIIGPDSPWWPRQIDDLPIRKNWAAPLCLWGMGYAPALQACDRPLAIVGSRGVNDYGRTVAHHLARHAAADGHTVVSGGAMGTDAAAHWGAIRAREQMGAAAGATVAVFAGGLTHIGPRSNQLLFDAIVDTGGILLSELFPGTIPQAHRFLLRNRIIAALASTVVIAQARQRSGALNTATWASELNREIYAIPGDITTPGNSGCNRLIADGKAQLLASYESVEDICHSQHAPAYPDTVRSDTAGTVGQQARTQSSDTQERSPSDGLQERILNALGNQPMRLEDLHQTLMHDDATTPAVQDILTALGLLELDGMVEHTAGGFKRATGSG